MLSVREATVWLLGYRDVPFAIRGIFRREVRHMLCWGVVWGGLNGNFCGYVAARSLHASDAMVATIAASVAVANLLAVWWGALIIRWPKKRFLLPAMGLLALVMFSFALTPLAPVERLGGAGRWWLGTAAAGLFAAQVIAGWILLQAINTARTHVWRMNFPESHRARVVARYAIWQVLAGSVWAGLMGFYLDGSVSLVRFGLPSLDLRWLPRAGRPDAYGVLMPLMAVSALAAAWAYVRLPVRGERNRASAATPAPAADNGLPHSLELSYSLPGWFTTFLTGVRSGLSDALVLLRRDRRFAQYMAWQFLAGSATMMIAVPLVLILKERFEVNYGAAAGLLTVVPQMAMVVATPGWAGLFDRWPLLRFRALHMCVWAGGRLLLAWGVWQGSLAVVGAAMAMQGVSLAAGGLAWNLGHMVFSDRQNDATYMGLHQTLTGVRGLTMPFLGLLLFRTVLGWHVIWISGVLQAISAFGFWRMRRREKRAAP